MAAKSDPIIIEAARLRIWVMTGAVSAATRG